MSFTQRQRSSLLFQVGYAMRNPSRIRPYLSRYARDLVLRAGAPDHISYYREVMRAEVADKSPFDAVGSPSHGHWLRNGRRQFEYLRAHGLRPDHTVLEIGCGNLRAGWRLIRYLETGRYHGVDISPDILLAAADTVVQYGLQERLPHLMLVADLTFSSLPDDHFDVVHAHSVFNHTPIEVIDECFAHVGRIMRPSAFFDFTFDRTEGADHQVLQEDFYYRTDTLTALASAHGLTARFMDDWEQSPSPHSKIRLTRRF
ncbi:class I SAM-dependent methyltransferase [Actinocorallia sp. API 0066]|uniref:class I SAM-dependent methyltransferase n=1 Tax=Actinocorallia sp. API 0066 TaxID=2896846 RepID=UPI001E2D0FE7|nr:class I SAM-dependent methyltransferase [Actinocorallia sp. API 0066]MCD0448350.1 class I SAM-dependent methyltransferase [Actinocorallia sp. API 0066]